MDLVILFCMRTEWVAIGYHWLPDPRLYLINSIKTNNVIDATNRNEEKDEEEEEEDKLSPIVKNHISLK